MSLLNTGQFWSLERDYYDETANVAPYETYEKFVSGVRNDSNIDDFSYTNPFSFTPSYGSSVQLEFTNIIHEYGDGYVQTSPLSINNVVFKMNLGFRERSDSEAIQIINYMRDIGSYGYFPYQTVSRDSLTSSDSYKSIYSIPPYFVQEFRCENIAHDLKYTDNNSVAVNLINNSISEFSIDSILNIPSMPTESKSIISNSIQSDILDVKPSFSVPVDIGRRDVRFMGTKSRLGIGKDGINDIIHSLQLSFENIDNEKLLKIISFIIAKRGTQKFRFNLPNPYPTPGAPLDEKQFICRGFEHTYLFKNTHALKCSIIQVPSTAIAYPS